MKKRVRLGFLIALLIAALALLILHRLEFLTLAKKDNPSDLNWLERTYGRKLYSQGDEELIIRDFFQDRRGGIFVDVGASHYRINSTTYYLDRHLGWSGLAIDALPEYEEGYLTYRKRTRFFGFFIADRFDDSIDFYITERNKRLSTFKKDWAERSGEIRGVKVPTITLNELLERAGIDRFDFLSMDIERAEPPALAGFDIRKYRPELVCIEAHSEVLEQIMEYFEVNRYVVIEKYKEIDTLNLYYTPGKGEADVAER